MYRTLVAVTILLGGPLVAAADSGSMSARTALVVPATYISNAIQLVNLGNVGRYLAIGREAAATLFAAVEEKQAKCEGDKCAVKPGDAKSGGAAGACPHCSRRAQAAHRGPSHHGSSRHGSAHHGFSHRGGPSHGFSRHGGPQHGGPHRGGPTAMHGRRPSPGGMHRFGPHHFGQRPFGPPHAAMNHRGGPSRMGPPHFAGPSLHSRSGHHGRLGHDGHRGHDGRHGRHGSSARHGDDDRREKLEKILRERGEQFRRHVASLKEHGRPEVAEALSRRAEAMKEAWKNHAAKGPTNDGPKPGGDRRPEGMHRPGTEHHSSGEHRPGSEHRPGGELRPGMQLPWFAQGGMPHPGMHAFGRMAPQGEGERRPQSEGPRGDAERRPNPSEHRAPGAPAGAGERRVPSGPSQGGEQRLAELERKVDSLTRAVETLAKSLKEKSSK